MICGSPYWPRRLSQRFCGYDCANRAKIIHETPVGKGHATRTRRYGGTYDASLDRLAVFERDVWLCGLCELPVDRERSWPDLMSASLDHIVPLSLGGGHEYGNVQCAHLGCNISKGTRLVRVG